MSPDEVALELRQQLQKLIDDAGTRTLESVLAEMQQYGCHGTTFKSCECLVAVWLGKRLTEILGLPTTASVGPRVVNAYARFGDKDIDSGDIRLPVVLQTIVLRFDARELPAWAYITTDGSV